MAESTEALEGLSYRDVQAKLKELGQPAKGYATAIVVRWSLEELSGRSVASGCTFNNETKCIQL